MIVLKPLLLLHPPQISHGAVMNMCRSHKHVSELYPSRDVLLCLDPFSGFGLFLWVFARLVKTTPLHKSLFLHFYVCACILHTPTP